MTKWFGSRVAVVHYAGIVLLVAAAVFAAGCAGSKATAPPPASPEAVAPVPAPPPPGSSVSTSPGPPFFVHVVRYFGESVSIIAAWYTGSIDNWKILAEVNPTINPDVIHEGMKINIPESMIKTHDPITKEFVESFSAKTKKPKAPASPAAGEEPVLFGPRH